MGKIKRIREFFWPILEKGEPLKEPTNDLEIKTESDEILKAIYDNALKRLDAEEDRKKVVENKSTIFIGTIGIITSIVIGVTSTLIKEKNFDGFMLLMVVLLFILTIYMLRTVWFAIKAIERKAYHSLSISDFCKQVDKQFYKNVITEINLVLQKNYPTTNSKVDNMTIAQEYFKRGIVVLGLFAIVILFLFFDRYGFHKWFESKINWEIDLNVSFSNAVILYIICSILSAAIILMFIQLRKLNGVIKNEKKKKNVQG
jgi:hypothetical protein